MPVELNNISTHTLTQRDAQKEYTNTQSSLCNTQTKQQKIQKKDKQKRSDNTKKSINNKKPPRIEDMTESQFARDVFLNSPFGKTLLFIKRLFCGFENAKEEDEARAYRVAAVIRAKKDTVARRKHPIAERQYLKNVKKYDALDFEYEFHEFFDTLHLMDRDKLEACLKNKAYWHHLVVHPVPDCLCECPDCRYWLRSMYEDIYDRTEKQYLKEKGTKADWLRELARIKRKA